MFQSSKIQVFEHSSRCLFSLLVVLQDHSIGCRPFHVVSSFYVALAAACRIFHQQDVVALLDLSILDGEHTVGFGDEGVRV